MTSMPSNWILANWSVIAALAGAGWGLFQYRRNSEEARKARRREQAIVAANEMETFLGQPDVKAALRMIDWSAGQIQVIGDDGTKKSITFNRLVLRLALRHHTLGRMDVPGYEPQQDKFLTEARQYNPADERMLIYFSSDEQAIRDIFDAFLARLERMETLIDNDVISADLFESHFGYWLRAMAENKTFDASTTFSSESTHRMLWIYIRRYQSVGVIRLFTRYGLVKGLKKPWHYRLL